MTLSYQRSWWIPDLADRCVITVQRGTLILSEENQLLKRYREVKHRKELADAICKMAARAAEPDGYAPTGIDVIRAELNRYSRSIKSRRLSLGFQNSMEVVRSRVAICSTQSDCLLATIQEPSSRILIALSDVHLKKCQEILADRNVKTLSFILDRLVCTMVAAEDLLYLCAEEDWRLAGLSVFLPESCAPCHSRFALVARDIVYTYYMLRILLERDGPYTDQLYTSIGEALTDASNQDWAIVLHKLESEPSKGSVHQEVYSSLLRKRFQGDASPNAPSLVPDWCWIPGHVKYEILDTVASGNFKSILKCKWLGLDVAIAVYNGEHAKNDMQRTIWKQESWQASNTPMWSACLGVRMMIRSRKGIL